jgi:hypothetical protein
MPKNKSRLADLVKVEIVPVVCTDEQQRASGWCERGHKFKYHYNDGGCSEDVNAMDPNAKFPIPCECKKAGFYGDRT